MKKAFDDWGGDFGDRAVELVAQFSRLIGEAEEFPVLGMMGGVEVVKLIAGFSGGVGPNTGGGTVAEETGANKDARIVIEIKGGRADFDGDDRDGGIGVGGKVAFGAAECRDGCATAEADDVLEVSV